MEHQHHLQSKCRFCLKKVTSDSYTVKNVTIQLFLTANYDNIPNFENEDDTQYAKKICSSCYSLISNYKRAQKTHKDKQKKKHMKTDFFKSLPPFNFPTGDDFKHCENCKVCENMETNKVNVQTPHVQIPQVEASPSSYKRKDLSPFETPTTKRKNIRQPGNGRKTLLMDKIERMEVDEEDPDIEMNKVSTIGTKIASEREIVKPENSTHKIMCNMSHVTCQLSHITCHMSPVMCHLSCVTRHVSPVTFDMSPNHQ